MSSLEGLTEGSPLVVSTHHGVVRRTVAKVAKVWLTDDRGYRFRIADGSPEGKSYGASGSASTVEQHEKRVRQTEEDHLLYRWGVVVRINPQRAMTSDQRSRLIELLRQFEAADGLPPELADHAFGRAGCQVVEGETLLAARARGGAAECAADAAAAFRRGDVADGRELLRSVARNLTAYTWGRLP